jgi:Phytanoyl-CoA dioxygenase (PhyH)
VKIEAAFTRETADAGRAILWSHTDCDPSDPATWNQAVVRVGDRGERSFSDAANTPILHDAFNSLVGKDRWLPRTSLGTFPIRFPSTAAPDDTGWHVDTSFNDDPGKSADFFSWRANIKSKGRALLMLFLFSDIEASDAPTRIRAGSHIDMARRLAPAGEHGMSLLELAANGFEESAGRREVLATGRAGTVYLCHPFLVHAAQPHRGTQPRFMAQPPLYPAKPFCLHRIDEDYSPVEQAIRQALA